MLKQPLHFPHVLSPSQAAKSNTDEEIQAHQAYERGDGQAAHQLSEEGKAHAAKMDQYNKQASDYIFRENNATGRVPDDTIDLHGQFVEEAEQILEQRIRYAQQNGQTHLHVYVALHTLCGYRLIIRLG
jgi:DNA-nicking Smr family endonuclease